MIDVDERPDDKKKRKKEEKKKLKNLNKEKLSRYACAGTRF